MKKLCFLLSMMLIICPLIACSQQSPTQESSAPSAAAPAESSSTAAPATEKEIVEITIFDRATEAVDPHILQAIDDFNKAHEGEIVVTGTHIADEQANLDNLRTSFATGNPPNVYHCYGGSRDYEYVKNGQLLDWDPIIASDTDWSGKFLNLWDKWQYPDVPGTFGVPYEMVASMLFINAKIFEECGLEPPETIEDFENCCDVLLENGYIPLAIGEKDIWRGGHFFNFLVMKSIGADGVTRLADRSLSYDSPEIRGLIQRIYDYNQKGYFGPNAVSVDYQQEQALFFTGESAMHFDGSWNIGTIGESEIIDDIIVVDFPYVNEQFKTSRFGNAVGLSVTKNSDPDVEEASVELVKAMSSTEFFINHYRVKGGQLLPVRIDPELLKDIPVSSIFTQFMPIVESGTEFRDDVQTYDTIPSLLDTFRYAVQGLFIGNSVDQCIGEIVDEIATRS